MKSISYWLDNFYEARPALSGNITTDIVIIGGGITGVSTAYHCAKRGLKTILIEKDIIASGAAGKNGGMVVEGLSVPFITSIKQIGLDATKDHWYETIRARTLVQFLIKEHSIECDLEQPGSLLVASTKSEMKFLRDEAAARNDAGILTEIIEAGYQLRASPFDLELYNPSDCMMHPVKFIRGLAQAAEEYGAIIYEGSPAIKFDAHTVDTPGGVITAQRVVLALESDHTSLVSDEAVITHEQAIVTEPLSDRQIADLDWKIGGMFWTLGEDYYNIRKIGSRLFTSGRIDSHPTKEELELHRKKLLEIIKQRLPSLKKDNVSISHHWTASTLKTENEWPSVRERDGLYEVFGNGDFGFTNGIRVGKSLTDFLSSGKDINNLG